MEMAENEKTEEFYNAIIDKNTTQISELVKRHYVNVNEVFLEQYVQHRHSGWSMIHIVSETSKLSGKHNEDLFELAVDLGADIMLPNKNGDLAIHLACKCGNLKLVKRLLELNSDCKDFRNNHGLTPLIRSLYHYSMQYRDRNLKIVSSLVDSGCDVNLAPDSGITPLHLAVVKDTKITKKLIQAGANVNCLTNSHQFESPLLVILSGNMHRSPHDTLAALLESGADVTVTNASGKTPLHIAVSRSDDISVSLLLNYGADPNALDKSYISPMWLSVDEHAMKILPLLVAHGGEINLRSRHKKSLLTLAVVNKDLEMMQLLLELGAVVTETLVHEENIMFYAIKSENPSIVKALLFENCPTNRPSYCNPEVAVLRLRNFEMIRLFASAGAKFQGQSLLVKSLGQGVEGFEEFLQECIYNVSSLRNICSISLRKHLGFELKKKLSYLTKNGYIPQSLSCDILLENELKG